ncbi:phosphopyruvate hydratase [candidate division WWE3 bacterium RIFCSPLOWO2_01_FULL_37_15]|uniref:Enolase n=1 Tax=candidate division WWE3 bacterium RIFCSPLOWO2_01_FULL_37_15 TaxID=1802622 RepID=A0A1F4USB1_UNCKA|nr:MAG: phosphopyruvate hydratase [candidate division WWE3 bacterium RIFCSPLOWO2_01_FULL_37_15]
MNKIESVKSYKIINSRGDWTIRTEIQLKDGSVGVSTIPEGASKGEREAVELPAVEAADNVQHKIFPVIKDFDPYDQCKIDTVMIEMDGTELKSNLGGNSILSVSLAVARACATSRKLPLYKYIAEHYGTTKAVSDGIKFPTPLFNVINGGKHAQNNLSFQEFMVIPSRNMNIEKALELGVNVYDSLKDLLHKDNYSTGVGDEGGFAPSDFTVHKALDYIKNAIGTSYKIGTEVFFGTDVAAESFYNNGNYEIKEEDKKLTREQLLDYYKELVSEYPFILVEDPYYEKDIPGWIEFTKEFEGKLIVVADDLVVTNPKILNDVIEKKLATGVIVKPNQVGTLSETLDFIKKAKSHGMAVIVSHRSGDTGEDTFISDLGVAVGADFIKAGAPDRGERVVKYNRLLEIYHSHK